MKRKGKVLLLLAVAIVAFAGFVVATNYAMIVEFFTALLIPNAVSIILISGFIFIIAIVAYKVAKAGEFRLDWWIFKKVGIGDRLITRDKARKISRDTLEKEYLLETGLAQMHGRELSLVCDYVIDTEKERRPFAVFVWTVLPFTGRKHDLAGLVESHFDEVFIVEVDLSNGYPAVSGRDQKETFDWLVKKHILSKPREEDALRTQFQEKIMEGFGIGMGEAAASKKDEKKEVKESEKA